MPCPDVQVQLGSERVGKLICILAVRSQCLEVGLQEAERTGLNS